MSMLVVGWLLLVFPVVARACVNWCQGKCASYDFYTSACTKYNYFCGDLIGCDNNLASNVCGAGTYACNSAADKFCCSIGGGNGCAGSAPSCDGGGCPDGTYCDNRSAAPKECSCKTPGGTGCPGGYVWVGPNDSVKRCCVMTNPSKPSLISPPNIPNPGSTLPSGDGVTLVWYPPFDWGGASCPNGNPGQRVWLGSAPTGMQAMVWTPAAYPTSVTVVGNEVVIAGENFPAPGQTVSVALHYQSAMQYYNTTRKLVDGESNWGIDPDSVTGSGSTVCFQLADLPSAPWDPTGFATFTANSACPTHVEGYSHYLNDDRVCATWVKKSLDASCLQATTCRTVCNPNAQGVCRPKVVCPVTGA
jgi:hypothetical protein